MLCIHIFHQNDKKSEAQIEPVVGGKSFVLAEDEVVASRSWRACLSTLAGADFKPAFLRINAKPRPAPARPCEGKKVIFGVIFH